MRSQSADRRSNTGRSKKTDLRKGGPLSLGNLRTVDRKPVVTSNKYTRHLLSEDSGHSSLNTSTADSRRSDRE